MASITARYNKNGESPQQRHFTLSRDGSPKPLLKRLRLLRAFTRSKFSRALYRTAAQRSSSIAIM